MCIPYQVTNTDTSSTYKCIAINNAKAQQRNRRYYTFLSDFMTNTLQCVAVVLTARCTLVQSAVFRSHIVCLSVRLSVYLSVTLVNSDHIGWNSSKIISPLVSLGCSLFATPTWRVCSKGNTPKYGPKVTHPLLIWASETFDHKLLPNGYR